MPSQLHQFYVSHRKVADGNEAFLDLVNHPSNPLTREDLEALLERRPHAYSRFAGWLDKLPSRT